MPETDTTTCRPCNGTGLAWGIGPEYCPLCHGRARVQHDPRRRMACSPCNGTGLLRGFERALCDICGGYGSIDPSPQPTEPGSSAWFVEGDKPHTERKRLAATLEALSGDVCVCDPYFGPGVLTAIEHLRDCDSVRCLTRDLGPGGKTTAQQQIRDFVREYPNASFAYVGSGDLHDRYVLTIDRLLLIGHGLKDFGTKESFVLVLDQQFAEDTIKNVRTTFDLHWTAARPLG